MQSKMSPSGHTFRVWHDFGNKQEDIRLHLLGGYSRGRKTIILFRFPIDGSTDAKDGMMELLPGSMAVRPVTDEKLMIDVESGDWDRYADLTVGTVFALGGRRWVKRDPDDLAKRLRRPLNATC